MEFPGTTNAQIIFIIFISFVTILVVKKLFSDFLITEFRNKYVLITGCDSGFGKLLARDLDQDGVHVFAACLTERGERALQESCSDKLRTLILDITNSEQIEQAVTFIKKNLPANESLWGLVNNAGVIKNAPFEWMTAEDMKFVFDVNTWGMVNTTKAFLPLLKQSKGRIVNIASVAGRIPLPFQSAYAMSKFAVESFSDCLRVEMKPFGVSVHIIEPALFRTNMSNSDIIKKDIERMWNQSDKKLKEEYGEVFLRRLYRFTDKVTASGSGNLEQVSAAMKHALISASPKHRYRVGWSLVLYILLYFPTWITDLMFSQWPQPIIAGKPK